MAVITKVGGGTTTPSIIRGYDARSQSTNIVHRLISGGIRVSLGDSLPRVGQLQLAYANRDDAWAAHALHATAGVFELVDAVEDDMGMVYVVGGDLRMELDFETGKLWTLTVSYQEVGA